MATDTNNVKIKKTKKVIIGDDAIDEPDTDWFEFEESAAILSEQLYGVSLTSGVCCGLSASWGSGKSSFMKLMVSHLKKRYGNNVCTAWFTAWDPCGIEDLGNAMLYQFAHGICLSQSDEIKKAVKELDEALGVRKNIKLRTGGILNTISKLAPEGGKEILETVGTTLNELGSPKKIKQCFETIVKTLESENKTAFFFIDDLDRSTGKQIFDLLSELKVYVSLPRIVVVLAYDEQYVLNAIKDSLPSGIDANNYLEKIITVRRVLPQATKDHLENISANILKSTLNISDRTAQNASKIAVELSQMNPRRLKRILLTYLGSLPKNWKSKINDKDEEGTSAYIKSSFVICVASEANLLKNSKIMEAFETGLEEDIISALKDIDVKDQKLQSIISTLIYMVQMIQPEFTPGLINELRLGNPIFKEDFDNPDEGTLCEKPVVGWNAIIEPVLTKAIYAGFQLNSKIALSSQEITLIQGSRKIGFDEFVNNISDDKDTQSYLIQLFAYETESCKFLTYTNKDSNILILIGDTPRTSRIGLPFNMDAELTSNKSFIFWQIFVTDSPIYPVNHYIDREKIRSKSFKRPFIYAVTMPIKVNKLFRFITDLVIN